ncbi:lamin tail domain-containing protein [Tengunoibacter tsumagoiensis]|uniref:LTD domain-containing protein n=1 Tax=Tengunoibacter tsumagoiensis TaxID=2014871 RepID=A0A402A1V1_9CHLR|nr:lamin tail domain-containing protein [Tengunoibacter tsumagoiensis]GCE13032.1 hypothetical protein KTT_28910 [Tengunoibacter tsumagoiensis]
MRVLVVFCTIFLAFLSLSVAISRASSRDPTSCAPAIPPPVQAPLVSPSLTAGSVVLNEVMLKSQAMWTCNPDTSAPSNQWIELYNPHDQALDLYGAHAALDEGPETETFYLPFSSAISAHGFMVMFLPHYLPATTSTLRLLMTGIVIDQVTLPDLPAETSYARIPDGSTTWQTTSQPTIDSSNTPPLIQATVQNTPTHARQKNIHPTPVLKTPLPRDTSASQGGELKTRPEPTTTALPTTDWGSMQFPHQTTNLPPPVIQHSPDLTRQSISADNGTMPFRLLLTLLVIPFLVGGVWLWRRFHRS